MLSVNSCFNDLYVLVQIQLKKVNPKDGRVKSQWMYLAALNAFYKEGPHVLRLMEKVILQNEDLGEMRVQLQQRKRLSIGVHNKKPVAKLQTLDKTGLISDNFTIALSKGEIREFISKENAVRSAITNVEDRLGIKRNTGARAKRATIELYKWILLSHDGSLISSGCWSVCQNLAYERGKEQLALQIRNGVENAVLNEGARMFELPTEFDLRIMALKYLLKLSIEQDLQLNCLACSPNAQNTEAQDPAHTCLWPVNNDLLCDQIDDALPEECDLNDYIAKMKQCLGVKLVLGGDCSYQGLLEPLKKAIQVDGCDIPKAWFDLVSNVCRVYEFMFSSDCDDFFDVC